MDGITISSDFPQKLAAIKGGIPAALEAALRAVAREVRKNFLSLDTERHKRGGMHFYKVEGTNRLSTRKLSDVAGEVIVDSKLMKHKYLGGRKGSPQTHPQQSSAPPFSIPCHHKLNLRNNTPTLPLSKKG